MRSKESLEDKEKTILAVGKYAFEEMKRRGSFPVDNNNNPLSEEEYLEQLLKSVRDDHFRRNKASA